MGAALAWFTTVVILIAGVLLLYQLGINLGAVLENGLHGVEQTLGRSLTP